VALVRRPSPHLAEGIVTHIERTVVDVDLAERQHAGSARGRTGRRLSGLRVHRGHRRGAELGYTPVVVDISEFERLEGCVTCLSVLVPS
jgi:hypothetical protein